MRRMILVDGNEAAASVAHRANEVIAIYPITPSSDMGEHADAWSAQGKKNVWGIIPDVTEMQSEGGASGAVHGALQAGSLTTTFTASQGLLLMIPNMYKIAGELTGTVFHIAARSIATHALSIFGDHSDIYACRQTGWGMLSATNVQEVHDFALISQAASLDSRIPFLHFFDGFRTSHEVSKIEELADADIKAMITADMIRAHRSRALTPDKPQLRGTAQNPDCFFQAREASAPFYAACPDSVIKAMSNFAAITGRQYNLFDYHGAEDADRVVLAMGSGCDAIHNVVDKLNAGGEKVGILKVRLFRPFSAEHFLAAMPASVKTIGVLDRTKEPGGCGEPLYMDIVTTLAEAQASGTSPFAGPVTVVGGRYGLSSKEFNPAMIKAVFDNLTLDKPRNHFTVGINDDVSGTSLDYDQNYDIEDDSVVRAMFYGLGSDGTVGANKNSIKIIGEGTDNHAQGYFVYDSKKAGAVTISHLRFGPDVLRTPYLIRRANFVACHQWSFIDQFEMLGALMDGGTFLVNSPYGSDEVWAKLPKEVQATLLAKKAKVYVIDAVKVARDAGMGGRINTVMQTCFFAISGVLERDEAIKQIKGAIDKTYGKKGQKIVDMNYAAVDSALDNMHPVELPGEVTSTRTRSAIVADEAPDFVKQVSAMMLAGNGDMLPVSAFTPDGTWPTGTAKWEKRNIAQEIPVWEDELCIQCNKCVFVCPHAAIRAKVYEPGLLDGAPETYKSLDYNGKDFPGTKYTIQVAPEDCTGCGLCVEECPGKDRENPERKALFMAEQMPLRKAEAANWDFFLNLPNPDRTKIKTNIKGSQFMEPLFEFSGACPGCGETPYIKLITQLFGDRTLITNATGCSSIYGGNLPTTPYSQNSDGRGPTWSNSLFEDNAEFGMGFRLSIDMMNSEARMLVAQLSEEIGADLAEAVLKAKMETEQDFADQRQNVATLRKKLEGNTSEAAHRLKDLADYLVNKSVWIVGGDGWAYDIGYGGLDHVLASGKNVNVLVLDTEVYSNTGGQASKATPIGAVAKFATGGKQIGKKDLGMIAMSYGQVYVAQVAFGAKDAQTINAIKEAESYDGPSLIIAYSPCIEHGYNLKFGNEHQALAVSTGYWPIYRFDPRRIQTGQAPLKLDCKAPSGTFAEYAAVENRFQMLQKSDPETAARLAVMGQEFIDRRWASLEHLAGLKFDEK
ncbi:MAG: pyruvate:ferredoxin (flavodoxin) oxidoreductase [Gemmatimonadales bacterium]|nr:pyruvate:ferredoxin (flavodoxin) oxidoreductase [Gemmatimonadales bacterium]